MQKYIKNQKTVAFLYFFSNSFFKKTLNGPLRENGFLYERKRLSLVDKTAFSGRENGFLYETKRLSLIEKTDLTIKNGEKFAVLNINLYLCRVKFNWERGPLCPLVSKWKR